MTNRSDDTNDSQPIPRLGDAMYTEHTELPEGGKHDNVVYNYSTLGQQDSAPPRSAHDMVHAVLDLLARSEHRNLLQTLTFDMRVDGTYFISLETKP